MHESIYTGPLAQQRQWSSSYVSTRNGVVAIISRKPGKPKFATLKTGEFKYQGLKSMERSLSKMKSDFRKEKGKQVAKAGDFSAF